MFTISFDGHLPRGHVRASRRRTPPAGHVRPDWEGAECSSRRGGRRGGRRAGHCSHPL